jgi:hypothetical protein
MTVGRAMIPSDSAKDSRSPFTSHQALLTNPPMDCFSNEMEVIDEISC